LLINPATILFAKIEFYGYYARTAHLNFPYRFFNQDGHESRRGNKMPKVLVIDDSRYTRLAIVRFLDANGFEVLEADNGMLGLAAVSREKPDAIITDLLMPEMDGYELLERLQADGNATPVIVITADIQDSTREKIMHRGARAVMNKPADLPKLLELLSCA
jgi:CheY-like chemotaxis protein